MAHDRAGLQCLADRRNQVLADLLIIAGGPTSNPQTEMRKKRPKTGTKEPEDYGSLYDKWRERFTDAGGPDIPYLLTMPPDMSQKDWDDDYAKFEKMVLQAESDLRLYVGEVDPATGIRRKVQFNVSNEITGADERDNHIIERYEGYEPEVVAIMEHCGSATVRTIRREHGRSEMTGRRR